MKADPIGVLTGAHYLDGDYACGEGAMAAGCRFVAGYPITPSTEVVERISRRFPTIGGTFIQMEDELASMAAVVGASWTGTKSMTVTSGPGFSLMMENIGLAAMMELPCVVADVQRASPIPCGVVGPVPCKPEPNLLAWGRQCLTPAMPPVSSKSCDRIYRGLYGSACRAQTRPCGRRAPRSCSTRSGTTSA